MWLTEPTTTIVIDNKAILFIATIYYHSLCKNFVKVVFFINPITHFKKTKYFAVNVLG